VPVGAPCLPPSLYPSLHNPQDPVAYGADSTGVTDSTAAINSALANGDAYFTMPGTYLVALSSGHGIIPPAGRTIECVPGVTLIETAQNPTHGNDGGILSLQKGGNTVIGCDFKGGNSAPGPVAIGTNQGQFLIEISSNNATIEGSTFEDTWGNSAIQVNSAYTGIPPANFLIQYNTFTHNPYYGPEVDQSTSGIIQNNLVIDGAIGPEDDSCGSSNGVGTVTIRNNELRVDVGNCALRGTPGCNAQAFITGGDYPPGCNYSGVSVTNNYCQGNTTQAALIHNVPPGGGGSPASYIGNIIGPHCSCQSGSSC
jgi:hypothetical protein